MSNQCGASCRSNIARSVNNVPASKDECICQLSFIETRLGRDSTNFREEKRLRLILVSCINRAARYWDWIYHCYYVDFHLLSQEINYLPSTKLWQPLQRNVIINLSYFKSISSLLTAQLETV